MNGSSLFRGWLSLSIGAVWTMSAMAQIPPSTVPVQPETSISLTWKDGKTSLETAQARIDLSTRVQLLYTHFEPDAGAASDSFRLRRVRTKLDGWIWSKQITYEVQADWAASSNLLLDCYLNWDALGDGRLQLRGGQFKVPFSRSYLTSSGNLQFVDRAFVVASLEKEYEQGFEVWGRPLGGQLEWHLAALNGGGQNKVANDNDRLQYDARVSYQPLGEVKGWESDFESQGKPLFSIGAAIESNDMRGATTGDDHDREALEADVVVKWAGFSLQGEWVRARLEPEVAAPFRQAGYFVQAGYQVRPGQLELVARYAEEDPRSDVRGDHRTESAVGINWYIKKHAFKIQADYRILDDESKDSTDRALRTQVQFTF